MHVCRVGYCDEGSANGVGALLVGATGLILTGSEHASDGSASVLDLKDRPKIQYRDVLGLEVLPNKTGITLAGRHQVAHCHTHT